MTSEYRAGYQIGNYILDSYIGGGGFGVVWRGHAVDSTSPVAIKILTSTAADGTSGTSSALRADIEVLAAAAGARSEHVVKVLGGGVDPKPYIVMEYVEGSDLLALLSSQGHLDFPMTIQVGIGVADALRVLSDAGIIHRDIKPANVMIDNRNVVKLADFGIAKIMGYETLTMTGQTAMTMAYAAPEVWDDSGRFGKPSTKLDLYALGVVLFQCLVGNLPFTGNFGSLYRQHTEVTANLNMLPEDTPPSLRTLIQRCLEKSQDDRPRDAAECLVLLQRAQGEIAQSSKREPTHFGPWAKDEPHESVAWAWHCHHEGRGDLATVEVHFTDDLEFASTLRKAVSANRVLAQYGAEKLIETSRLLLHPDEAWTDPPPGRFQFWIAREDLEVPTGVPLSEGALATAVEGLTTLADAAEREGVQLDFGSGNLRIRPDGSVYLRRPVLSAASGATDSMLFAALWALPLLPAARALVDEAGTFRALVDRIRGASAVEPVAPEPVAAEPVVEDSEATVVIQRRRPDATPPADATIVRDADATIVGQPRESDATVVGRPREPDATVVRRPTPPASPPPPVQQVAASTPAPQSQPPVRQTPPAAEPVQPVVARRLPPVQQSAAPPSSPPPAAVSQRSAPPPRAASAASPPGRMPPVPPDARPRKGGSPWWLTLGIVLFGIAGVAAAAFFLAFDGDVHKLPGLALKEATPAVVIETPTAAPGSGNTPVTGGAGSARPLRLVDALLFVSDRDGHEEIYIMNMDGTEQRRLTNTPKANSLPDAAPDSARVVFVSGREPTGGSELFEMRADGALPTHIPTVAGDKLEPNISPDGKRLVFEVKVGDNYDVYAADIDGKNAVNLTNSPTADIDPVWSADGKQIVFGSNRADNKNMEIWVMNANGTGAHQLTNAPGLNGDAGFNGEPDWSPDGKKIAFESNRLGHFDLYTMNTDGSNVVRLGEVAGDEYDPAWSPDGKLIAYTSNAGTPGATNEVMVINADGTGAPRNVSNNPANDGKPAWVKVRRAVP